MLNPSTAVPTRPGWAYLAMSLVALVTLSAELLFTRVISVMAHYHLAFFIICLAVLGMTAGALLIYVWPGHFQPRQALPMYAVGFFISVPLAVGCNFAIVQTEQGSLTGIIALAMSALVTGVPFVFAGILISLTLTRCGLPYGRIYGADLLGAAAGCLLFIPLLDRLSPSSVALLLSALGALAAWSYRRMYDLPAQGLLLAWPVVMGLLLAVTEGRPNGLVPLAAKGQPINPRENQFLAWNSLSLVMVGKTGRYRAFFWGMQPNQPRGSHEQAMLTIDGGAGTPFLAFDGDLSKLRWLNDDVTTLAYQVQAPGAVAIIGLGGGRDVLGALANGADRVVGIDVNPLILELHQGQLKSLSRLAEQANVALVCDEARSFLTRDSDRYDVIQMSLVDTWAASAAGAYTLSENGLYTQEAWGMFIGRLTDRGAFTASRWYAVDGMDESNRLIALAVAACLRQNLTPPSDHIVLASGGKICTLIIARQPIAGALRERLDEVCRRQGFDLLVAPGLASPVPSFDRLMACQSLAELEAVCAREVADIRPSSDDRPYFFNQLRFWRLDHLLFGDHAGASQGNRRAATTVFVLLAISVAGMTVGIYWPLRRVGLPPGFPPTVFRLGLLYFAAIGLGFMLVEMAFVQRFSTFLGHPSYALACVIGSMVLASGIGSLLSDTLPLKPSTFLTYPVVVLVVQLIAWLLMPWMVATFTTQPLPARIAATMAFTMPCGLVMGLCLPLGLVQLCRHGPDIAPWMWGINGAASVIGAILAILLSISLGISATFLAGIACYGLVLLVNYRLTQTTPSEAIESSAAELTAPCAVQAAEEI